MNCQFDKTLLQDLLEGIIDPIEKLFVDEHIKYCQECRRELTELKLLFWDLNDVSNYEIELPPELDLLKDSLIERTASKESKRTAKLIISVQQKKLKATGKFLANLPGAKTSNTLVIHGLKSAPSVIGKVSKGLIKGTKFLLAQ